MKHHIIITALIAALVGTYAGSAISSSDTSTTLRSRIGQLERQVRVLRANDGAMRQSIGVTASRVTDVEHELDECFKTVIPITRYTNYWNGDPPFYTSALDWTAVGGQVHFWAQAVDASCVVTFKHNGRDGRKAIGSRR